MNEIYRARVNQEGRMFIPAACRAKLGIAGGEELLVEISERGLLLYKPEHALQRLQDWVSEHVPPGTSLVDELIAERRTEAAREAGE
jgi:antitoxin PrlF